MADSALQPRTRHLIAMFALLISSVGGFAPHTRGRLHVHDDPNSAVAPARTLESAAAMSSLLRSCRPSLHRGRCRQRGEWGGTEQQRLPGALCGQGLAAVWEATEQRAGYCKSFFEGGSRRRSARGWRRTPTRSMAMMALHFPKPPKMPKPPPPPPPPPPGDKARAGGKSEGRHASSAVSTGSGSRSATGTSKGHAPPSSKANAWGAVTGAAAEGGVGVSGVVAKAQNVSVGHGNATRTDLNGGKTVRRRRTTAATTATGVGTGKSGGSGTTSTSLPRKRRVASAKTGGAAGETRKLRRRPRSPTSRVPADGTPGVKALVVKDDMELADMMALVTDVLERLGETERELRRLRKEGSLAKPNRAEVRGRKFVIDTRAKMIGAAFAGSVAGMIVGWSVLPNLWLVGGVTGALAFAALSRSSTGTAGSICSTCGIQVALIYKDIRDWWEQTVFLYKTGKLSYTYWRGFERYDQAWGLSAKYTETVAKLSKEALELDRQYKIRQKTLRAGKRLTKLSRQVGSSAAKEVTTFASSATGWGGNQLRQWGLLGDDPDAVGESPGVFGGLLKSKKKLAGGRGSASAKRRPLGFSVVLDGVFGERSRSIYSAPPAGGSRKPGYRGDPVIPARIRHMFMTSKQIRDERLQKYRVGFMGMRLSRSFDKDD